MLKLHWPYVVVSARHSLLLLFETQILETPLAKYSDFDFRKLQKDQPVASIFEY